MSTTCDAFDTCALPLGVTDKRFRMDPRSFVRALAGWLNAPRARTPKAPHFEADARLRLDMRADALIGEIRDHGPGTLLENEIRRLR
ncbi:MAG: hypothetical protein NXI19_03795 [Alphaproteobacteria bacterium]|nr:hypothetical protein [Alphaproteobacteria bacterium]